LFCGFFSFYVKICALLTFKNVVRPAPRTKASDSIAGKAAECATPALKNRPPQKRCLPFVLCHIAASLAFM
jgi:hypothetical protein